ncbi:MAG: hypothetical protein KAS71_11240, partial [Bacteroidales bacterium]|nr:hypothetical protein [Bacteroidales bacterium]
GGEAISCLSWVLDSYSISVPMKEACQSIILFNYSIQNKCNTMCQIICFSLMDMQSTYLHAK